MTPIPPLGTPLAPPALQLRPGCTPAIVGATASPWPARLALGRPAADLPQRMAALHALCAGGHQVAAQLAVQAAQGRPATPGSRARRSLRLAVLRDHLRHLGHDWPLLLQGRADPALGPAEAPVWCTGDDAALAALPAWLEARWLGWPLPRLLAAWRDDPARAAQDWLRTARTPLSALLAPVWPALQATRTPQRPLGLDEALAPAWAVDTAVDPAAPPSRPSPETGPWHRLNHDSPPPAHNAGMRLFARLIDLLHLAGRGGDAHLSLGAIDAGAGAGLAWAEVGRGLLAYHLRVTDTADGPRVAALALRTPTDWNAHPQGVLAHTLAALPPTGSGATALRLAQVWDPCLPCTVQHHPDAEVAHA